MEYEINSSITCPYCNTRIVWCYDRGNIHGRQIGACPHYPLKEVGKVFFNYQQSLSDVGR